MTCAHLIEKYGADSKYVKDCQIRAIRGLPYDQAAALIGWTDPPPIIIHAGIGTLVIGTEHQDFTPAPTTGQKAKSWLASLGDRTPATAEQIEARTAICDTCPLKINGACSACGCGLKAKISLANQKCPKGMW